MLAACPTGRHGRHGSAEVARHADNPGPSSPPRTFARVRGFDLACPNCGAVDVVPPSSGPALVEGHECFDWWRSRWRCRACRRVFAVGLVLWPTMADETSGGQPPRRAATDRYGPQSKAGRVAQCGPRTRADADAWVVRPGESGLHLRQRRQLPRARLLAVRRRGELNAACVSGVR